MNLLDVNVLKCSFRRDAERHNAFLAWITTDRDFARFPGLKWQHPLDHPGAIDNPT